MKKARMVVVVILLVVSAHMMTGDPGISALIVVGGVALMAIGEWMRRHMQFMDEQRRWLAQSGQQFHGTGGPMSAAPQGLPCATCMQPLAFVPQYQQHWCPNCQAYKQPVPPPPGHTVHPQSEPAPDPDPAPAAPPAWRLPSPAIVAAGVVALVTAGGVAFVVHQSKQPKAVAPPNLDSLPAPGIGRSCSDWRFEMGYAEQLSASETFVKRYEASRGRAIGMRTADYPPMVEAITVACASGAGSDLTQVAETVIDGAVKIHDTWRKHDDVRSGTAAGPRAESAAPPTAKELRVVQRIERARTREAPDSDDDLDILREIAEVLCECQTRSCAERVRGHQRSLEIEFHLLEEQEELLAKLHEQIHSCLSRFE